MAIPPARRSTSRTSQCRQSSGEVRGRAWWWLHKHKDMVAPSTTTTAQTRTCNRNEAESRRCNSTLVVWKMAGRRSRGAEFPNGDPETPRLVGEVVLDSRPREMHDADRQQFKHGVVASERCCLGVLRPVRLESGLRHLAATRPFGGDQLGALLGTAMDKDHVGMLGVNL